MREILFRCWNEYGKCFHGMNELGGKLHLFNNKNPSYVVEQFTGLSDCNGVKIFEGDIVEDEEHYISKIYWDVNDFMFCATDVGGLVDMCSQTKVIGNIHQNPELLES